MLQTPCSWCVFCRPPVKGVCHRPLKGYSSNPPSWYVTDPSGGVLQTPCRWYAAGTQNPYRGMLKTYSEGMINVVLRRHAKDTSRGPLLGLFGLCIYCLKILFQNYCRFTLFKLHSTSVHSLLLIILLC